MGLLDPKLDKPRTLALLRKKGATKAVLEFDGGHDEGSVQSITLTLVNGAVINLPTWYCGGYSYQTGGGHVPLSQPENEDEELADLLEGPINSSFGSWGDVPHTQGTCTWDVAHEEVILSYDQETYQSHNERVSF